VWASRDLLFPRDDQPQFLVREQLGPFFAPLVERPPALPLLAVRAARRAVADNPADANAWLRLGQAYLVLGNTTRERSVEGLLPPLSNVRHVQIVTALEQAVRLNPDIEDAHRELARLYGQSNYFDQALEHQREELRLSRRAGPRAGETAEEFDHRLETLDKDTAKLEELVQDRRQKYAAGSRSLQGDRRAQADMALQLGLARLAVDEVLLTSSADVLGPAGIKLELDLMLRMGRAAEVRKQVLNDPGIRANKHILGYYQLPAPRTREGAAVYALPYQWPAYEWLQVLEGAAVGDYGQARADLGAARAEVRARHGLLRQRLDDVTRRSRTLVPGLLADRPPLLPVLPALPPTLGERAALEVGDRIFRGQEADLCVLEGMLALEQGDTPAARSAFAEARRLSAPDAGAEVPFAGRPIATGYLGQLNAQN
jgi:tetratricopeptide (TPR) repeat protein